MVVCRRRSLSLLLTVLVLLTGLAPGSGVASAVAAQSSGDTLIQPRGDAGQTGTMPGEGPATEPGVRWEATSDGNTIMGMAIRDDDLAFTVKAGSAGFIRVVELATGEERWTADFGSDAIVFGPAIAGDLYVVGIWTGGDVNQIRALDAASGDEVWSLEVAELPAAPTYDDGVIYVGMRGGLNADSALVALEAESGNEIWRYDAPEALDLGERVAVADGIVVAAGWSLEDAGIGAYAFDAESGELLWTFAETDKVTFDPVVADGVVVIMGLPSVWALDLESGDVLWSESIGSVSGGLALADGVAYFGLEDEARALDLATGEEVWSSPVTSIAGAPIVAGGIVYTAAWRSSGDQGAHHLHALDAGTGDEVWAKELDYQVNGNQPLAAGGVLYVDTDDAVVAFGGKRQYANVAMPD